MELSDLSTKEEEEEEESAANFGDYTIGGDDDDDDENAETLEQQRNENNQANNNNNPPPPSTRQPQIRRTYYREGFTTSICHLFQNHNSNRTDCCIFACCGTLLSDRTHYLLKKERPTSWWIRFFFILIVPLCLLIIGDYIQQQQQQHDDDENGVFPTSHLLFVYFLVLLIWGRVKRIERRQYIVGKLYELEEQEEQEEEQGRERREGEGVTMRQQRFLYDSVRAHRTIGCYPIELEEENQQQDLCGCIWKILAKLCCASCCGCWLQCCGMCAVGQEDREVVERIVGKEATLIDYVTFQPYSEYYPKLENLRTTLNSNLWTHYSSLSKLSIQLLKSLGLAVLVLFVYAALDIDSNFTMENMVILIATFCQPFFILYFVHWKWKKFDLSLDAVVKYFASGFLLTTAMAMIFEMLLSIVVQLIYLPIFMIWIANEVPQNASQDEVMKYIVLNHPGMIIFYFFINSFLMAALVEEIVKYFGYWMVIHPDLMDVDDVGSAISEASSDATTSLVLEGENDGDVQNDVASGDAQQDQQQASPPQRSLNSLGDGITVAMIAVALGFACCENLMYIFVYTPPSVGLEISTLLVRSIFPVHPLCAAIQSINVCQRDLEKENHIQLGRIIFPSVILHGTFDFVLMVMAFVDAYNTIKEGGDSSDESEGGVQEQQFSWDSLREEIPSLLVAFVLVVVGLVYYAVRSRAQRARLNALEIGSGMALVGDTSLV